MKRTVTFMAAAALLGGCASSNVGYETHSELRTKATHKATKLEEKPMTLVKVPKVIETEQAHIPLQPRKVSEHAWLRTKKVTIQTGRDPVPMTEILRALSAQGLTITSELPLDRFQYSGFSLLNVDAESALRAVVTSVGLDYQADAQRKIITVTPMSSKTWYLNMGNRRSQFAAGGNNSANPSTDNAVAKALTTTGGNSESGNGQTSGKSEVTSQDDFWSSLKAELDSRLTLLLPEPPKVNTATAAQQSPAAPRPSVVQPTAPPPSVAPTTAAVAQPAPGAPAPAPIAAVQGKGAGPSSGSDVIAAGGPMAQAPVVASGDGILSYSPKKVGSYAVNPETGAVTVQAPHWVLQDLDAYFKRVQNMYNTDIVFQGELVMLTTDNSRSEGLDISSFAKFANSKYGVVYKNNGLGGVTVSFPDGGSLIPQVAAGPGALSGPLLGVQSMLDGLQIFNNYLTNLGKVSTLQKPVLTTTSGVPADFRRTVTRYFNTVSQETAQSGTGAATMGTKNMLIAQDFGTILRVNPRVDVSTGLIRAQIELVQATQLGTQSIPQTVTSGNSVQQIATQLPIVSKIVYSGEALLRDGDMVVMGGQTEDFENNNREGITGLMDVEPVGGVFGKTMREKNRNVFYFALKVSVNKR